MKARTPVAEVLGVGRILVHAARLAVEDDRRDLAEPLMRLARSLAELLLLPAHDRDFIAAYLEVVRKEIARGA